MRIHLFAWWMVSTCIFFSCKKNSNDSITKPLQGKITISEKVVAENIFGYYSPGEKYNTVRLFIPDTIFHLFPRPDGKYENNGIELYFKASFDSNYRTKYQWKIGDDPLIRTEASFALNFEQPVGRVLIRLITSYTLKTNNSVSGFDTTYQHIFIGENSPLFGEYEGYNIDEPDHVFTIRLGWDFEPYFEINRSYFSLFNLPEGYPIKSEIIPRSSCFGIDGATIFNGQILSYRDEWVNSVYALGFMSKNRDSINIRYNYGIIDTSYVQWNPMQWTRVVPRNFIGKKK